MATFDRRCEERIGSAGYQCGAPAKVLVKHKGRNEGPYFMCLPCADHNILHRDGEALVIADGVDPKFIERWKPYAH